MTLCQGTSICTEGWHWAIISFLRSHTEESILSTCHPEKPIAQPCRCEGRDREELMSRQSKKKDQKLNWVDKSGWGTSMDFLVSDSPLPLMVRITITLSLFSSLCNKDFICPALLREQVWQRHSMDWRAKTGHTGENRVKVELFQYLSLSKAQDGAWHKCIHGINICWRNE